MEIHRITRHYDKTKQNLKREAQMVSTLKVLMVYSVMESNEINCYISAPRSKPEANKAMEKRNHSGTNKSHVFHRLNVIILMKIKEPCTFVDDRF